MQERLLINDINKILSANSQRKLRYSAELMWLNAWENLWMRDKIRVGVIGITSTGKSTLINAILGKELLSMAVRPSSNQLVSCSYSKIPATIIHFVNGEKKEVNDVKILKDIIMQHSDEDHNKRNQKRVAQLEVTTPEFVLGEDVLLVDSPGLDATGYEAHETLTLETLLPTVDVVIYVTTVKSEVDEKMRRTLDIIAKYECPIMVVQNMLDAVRPSIDGVKSAADVAKERLNRVKLAVNQSKIKDKRGVKIVQISARFAMEYRCSKRYNELDAAKYKLSRFDNFISGVKALIEHKRPEIEQQRVNTILNRIDELITQENKRIHNVPETLVADNSLDNISVELDSAFSNAKRNIDSVIAGLQVIYDKYIQEKTLTSNLGSLSISEAENNINKLKSDVSNFEQVVVGNVQDLSQRIYSIANKLNVPIRDLWSYNGLPRMPEMAIKTKTVERSKVVKKKGIVSSLLRIVTLGLVDRTETVYYTEKVLDKDATIDSIIGYLKRLQDEYGRTLASWENSVESTVKAIKSEINIRKIALQEKKKLFLDAEDWRNTRTEIERCTKTYRKVALKKKQDESVPGVDSEFCNNTRLVRVSKLLCGLHNLSEKYLLSIQRSAFKFALKDKNRTDYASLVIANSGDDIKDFLYRFMNIGKINITSGRMQSVSDNICVALAPNQGELKKMLAQSSGYNIFLLINGLQFHTEFETNLRKAVMESMTAKDALYISIQDFEILANGNGTTECIRSVVMEKEKLINGIKGLALINHNNPVYNMAIIHEQTTTGRLKEETVFYSSLSSKFPALVDENVKKRIKGILRSF